MEEFIVENEETNDVNVRSLVLASKLGLKKLSLYYQKTDQTYIFACSTLLDCSLKFNYWRDEDWEARVILDQENACVDSFRLFLYSYFNKQQSFSSVGESTATLSSSLETAESLSTATTSTATPLSETSPSVTPSPAISSSAATVSTTTTTTTTTTRSFGVSCKRKMKLKNKTLSEINKKQRSSDASIQELVDIHLSELNTFVNNDDTSHFPVEELIFESYTVNDNTLVPDDYECLNENGYGNNQEEGPTSEVLSLNSKYFKNQKVLKSQLQNGLAFAQQSLHFWKHFELKYPTLSLFDLKVLSIPATSVASERLFSTAKRVINNNSTNLSATGETAVLLSC